MKFNKILKNIFLVLVACVALSACATQKVSTGQMQGDVYTGTDTVEYLASGVPDRVFRDKRICSNNCFTRNFKKTSSMVKKKF